MLPLLPALILLLLQGPSNFERLVVDGRLPAALEAIHRQMASSESEQLSDRDQQELASLLSGGIDSQLSHAFLALFKKHEPANQPRQVASNSQNSRVPDLDLPHGPRDGFERSQRSRDGPFAFGSVR